MASADETIQGETLELENVCPNVDGGDVELMIGIDLNQLITTVTNEFNITMKMAESRIEYARALVQNIDEGLTTYEALVEDTDELTWLVPATLFAAAVLTVAAMFGVILAWRGRSTRKIQNIMSYVVLPLLIATTIACWSVVLMASLGTMVGSDMCTSGTSTGSPDETIQEILGVLNVDPNSTGYKAIQAYTNVSTTVPCLRLSSVVIN